MSKQNILAQLYILKTKYGGNSTNLIICGLAQTILKMSSVETNPYINIYLW